MSNNRSSSEVPDFPAMRNAMVVSQLRPNGVTDTRLLAAMGAVPRESFLPEGRRAVAYADRPVVLSDGRALNPPMTTARLIDTLRLNSATRLLIVGAASGYAAAVTASLCQSVVAVEQDADLFAQASGSAPANVQVVKGALNEGAPDHAPFDAILIDGAVERVPDAIVVQLATDGQLACAIVKDGVTRLATGRRGGSSFAVVDFADAEAVVLPGFAPTPEFVF